MKTKLGGDVDGLTSGGIGFIMIHPVDWFVWSPSVVTPPIRKEKKAMLPKHQLKVCLMAS